MSGVFGDAVRAAANMLVRFAVDALDLLIYATGLWRRFATVKQAIAAAKLERDTPWNREMHRTMKKHSFAGSMVIALRAQEARDS